MHQSKEKFRVPRPVRTSHQAQSIFQSANRCGRPILNIRNDHGQT